MSKFSSCSPPTTGLPRRMSQEQYQHDILKLHGPVNKWLAANLADKMANNVFICGFLAIDDIREDQVWCTVKHVVLHVSNLVYVFVGFSSCKLSSNLVTTPLMNFLSRILTLTSCISWHKHLLAGLYADVHECAASTEI
jgi:hypothetical protein